MDSRFGHGRPMRNRFINLVFGLVILFSFLFFYGCSHIPKEAFEPELVDTHNDHIEDMMHPSHPTDYALLYVDLIEFGKNGCKIAIQNGMDSTFYMQDTIKLRRQSNGNWIDYTKTHIDDDSIPIRSIEKHTIKQYYFDWTYEYGYLPCGYYMLELNGYSSDHAVKNSFYTLYCEFSIADTDSLVAVDTTSFKCCEFTSVNRASHVIAQMERISDYKWVLYLENSESCKYYVEQDYDLYQLINGTYHLVIPKYRLPRSYIASILECSSRFLISPAVQYDYLEAGEYLIRKKLLAITQDGSELPHDFTCIPEESTLYVYCPFVIQETIAGIPQEIDPYDPYWYDGSTLELDTVQVTVEYATPDECSFHIKNTGKETVTFGASQFPLYFSFGDDWFPVMRIRSIGFGGSEIQLSAGKEYNLRIPFTQIYGRLTKGSYRILLRTTKGEMVYVSFEL